MAKKNELAVMDTFKLAKPFEGMDPELLEELEDELADLDEGGGIECRRIKMPSGGALAFEVEGEDGDSVQPRPHRSLRKRRPCPTMDRHPLRNFF